MDFPEHLKLLQQRESLWGEGSEQEEGRRERQKGVVEKDSYPCIQG